MLSYGGVTLPDPDPSLLARVEAALPASDLRDFCRRTFPGRLRVFGLPWLTRDWVPRLQTLCWPNTASRWAEGWFFADDQQLGTAILPGSIRQQAYQGGTLTALPLKINDGRRTVTTNLFLLPPVPLSKVLPNLPGLAPGTYLLPLVDARYFWWSVAAQIASGVTSWASLFAEYATALGITLAVDAIPAAYKGPPGDFGTNYEFLPPQLDAACRATGLRLIANLDGTYRAASAATGAMLLSVNSGLVNPSVAGGLIDLTNDLRSDLAGVLPQSVTVLFPAADASGGLTGGVSVQTVTLASLTSGTPTLPQFVGAATYAGTELLRCSLILGPGNVTEAQAMAAQIAADWYAWHGVERAHLALSGAAAWTPTGGEERIEWSHAGGTILTRVRRPPWNWRDENTMLNSGSLGGGGGGDGGGGGGSTVVNNLYVTGILEYSTSYQTLSSATYNNYTLPNTPKVAFALSTNVTITGFAGGAPGRQIYLWNTGGGILGITNQDAASAAANRIIVPTGVTYFLQPNDAVILEYDGTAQRWRFDHPTFAVGSTSAIFTQACRWLKAGTGITSTDNGDGSNTLSASAGTISAQENSFGGFSTTASGSWQSSTFSLTLPAGTFLCWVEGHATGNWNGTSSSNACQVRFWDGTQAYTSGEVVFLDTGQASGIQQGCWRTTAYVVNPGPGSITLTVQAFRSANFTSFVLTASGNFGYLKIA